MLAMLLAVAMNSTFRQVVLHVDVVIVEGGVLLRVEHLEQRARRVAWFETVTLSTSSRMMTGLDEPQRLMVWMIRPGMAPM